jgi:hypothetical protein
VTSPFGLGFPNPAGRHDRSSCACVSVGDTNVSTFLRRHSVRLGTQRLLERTGWAGAAVAGAVLGHLLTYVVAFVNAATRHSVLEETGHSYWSFASAAAVLLGVSSAALVVVRRLGSPEDGGGEKTLLRSASRLAAVQLLLFACIEIAERLVDGAPVRGLLNHGLVPLGLAIQILVAFGLALLLRGLASAAELLARQLLSSPTPRLLQVWPLPIPPPRPRLLLLSGAWGLRGPPGA